MELILKMYLNNGGEYIQGLVSICLALTHSFYIGEKILWYSEDRDRLLEACPDVFSESNLYTVFMSIMEKYGHASSLQGNFKALNEGCHRIYDLIKAED